MKIKRLKWSNPESFPGFEVLKLYADSPVGVFTIKINGEVVPSEITLNIPPQGSRFAKWEMGRCYDSVESAAKTAQEIFEMMVIGCLEDEDNG